MGMGPLTTAMRHVATARGEQQMSLLSQAYNRVPGGTNGAARVLKCSLGFAGKIGHPMYLFYTRSSSFWYDYIRP